MFGLSICPLLRGLSFFAPSSLHILILWPHKGARRDFARILRLRETLMVDKVLHNLSNSGSVIHVHSKHVIAFSYNIGLTALIFLKLMSTHHFTFEVA